MPAGPGRYDDACTAAREMTGGSVVLIVLGGKLGQGFSVQTEDLAVLAALPAMLETIAAQIRADLNEGKPQ